MATEKEAAEHPLWMPLRDIYGRNMGEVVGIIFNLDGKIQSIAVSESAGRFVSYPGARVAKRESQLVVVPEWRAEAENLARQKESLKKREEAIEELARCRDLDAKIYDEMSAEITAARASHQRLREKVEVRLRELEERQRSVSDFIEIAKVQHATTEIDEWAYNVTAEFGRSQLETDAKELGELRSAIGYLEDIEEEVPASATEELPAPEVSFPPVIFDLKAGDAIPQLTALTAL